MCLCFLWCFGNRRCLRIDELSVLYPSYERHYTVAGYIHHFLLSVRIIARTDLWRGSVSYCRTRGPSAYPFLLVQLRNEDPGLYQQPVMFKFQGFDGPPSEREPGHWVPTNEPQADTTLSLGYVGESARTLVGTRRYDVCHTMKCHRGNIVDLLVLAQITFERDRTRRVFPVALFLALQSVCDGTVKSNTKSRGATPLAGDIEEKNAVVDAFPARREQMLEDMNQQYKNVQFRAAR